MTVNTGHCNHDVNARMELNMTIKHNLHFINFVVTTHARHYFSPFIFKGKREKGGAQVQFDTRAYL